MVFLLECPGARRLSRRRAMARQQAGAAERGCGTAARGCRSAARGGGGCRRGRGCWSAAVCIWVAWSARSCGAVALLRAGAGGCGVVVRCGGGGVAAVQAWRQRPLVLAAMRALGPDLGLAGRGFCARLQPRWCGSGWARRRPAGEAEVGGSGGGGVAERRSGPRRGFGRGASPASCSEERRFPWTLIRPATPRYGAPSGQADRVAVSGLVLRAKALCQLCWHRQRRRS